MHMAGGGSSHKLLVFQPCTSAPELTETSALQTDPAQDNWIVCQSPKCGCPLLSLWRSARQDLVIQALSIGKAGKGSPDGNSTQLSS